MKNRPQLLFCLSLILPVFAIFLAYLPLFQGGIWFYDDGPNLSWLANVESFSSAWQGILSGISGPSGRPVSNITFLLNINDWNEVNPTGFVKINVLFHGINTFLVYLICLRLCEYLDIQDEGRRKLQFCFFVTAIWGLAPLHFTPILMSVQRMTLVAGTFSLLGLWGYLAGRKMAEQGEWQKGSLLMGGSLGAGTLIGFFAKENGALLPLYALVLEVCLLSQKRVTTPDILWRSTKLILFALPTAMIFIYIIVRWPGFVSGYANREFTLSERLATQSVILWDYLRLLFIPNVTSFSPFHDDTEVLNFRSPLVLIATTAWLAVIGLAYWFWKKSRLFVFAIGWFIVGHFLESTFIPLELYFEHRNYMPVLGIIIAVVVVALKYPRGIILPILWLLLSSFSLIRLTTLWSKPLLASELMVIYHPYSTRAATNLAMIYEVDNLPKSYQILRSASERIPSSGSINLTTLQQSCGLGKEKEEEAFNILSGRISDLKMDHIKAITSAIEDTFEQLGENQCEYIDYSKFDLVVTSLLSNDHFSKKGEMRYRLQYMKASILGRLELWPEAVTLLLQAMQYRTDPANLLELALLYQRLGRNAEGIESVTKLWPKIKWRQIQSSKEEWHHRRDQTLWLLCQEQPLAVCEKYKNFADKDKGGGNDQS